MLHRAYVGIGSNLGDRRANIFSALQRMRAQMRVDAVSSFYESPAADGAQGPAFLNVAASIATDRDREALERALDEIVRALGRAPLPRLAARPIDIDLLAFDDWVRPQLAARPYNAVPLAEIASQFGAAADGTLVRRVDHGMQFRTDRQEEPPELALSLDRAGVARVRRVLHLDIDGRPATAIGSFSMIADLASDRAGVHMSRFVESLDEATLDAFAKATPPMRIERLAESVAREIARSQKTTHAEVRLDAEFSLERWTPVSGKRVEETYRLFGIAHVRDERVRQVVGVEAEGMTACPCAQGMVREDSLRALREAGFDEEGANRALDALPIATHNQRGRGVLAVGTAGSAGPAGMHVGDLVEIVEGSMSSETYDLLKRPDEFFVVNKAHRNPKFVEDVVRAIVGRALETYEALADDAFLFASQHNDESIHKHDAFAELFGTFAELRSELRGAAVRPRTDLAAWLRGA
jgi:GTP cyclohydrolase-4